MYFQLVESDSQTTHVINTRTQENINNTGRELANKGVGTWEYGVQLGLVEAGGPDGGMGPQSEGRHDHHM